jgi:hypothetical protein
MKVIGATDKAAFCKGEGNVNRIYAYAANNTIVPILKEQQTRCLPPSLMALSEGYISWHVDNVDV